MRPFDFQGRGRAALVAIACLFGGAWAFAQSNTVGPLPGGMAGTFGPPYASNGGNMSFGGGAAPTINAACGTAPVAPAGTDSAAFFTSGTSTAAGCTITFATPWKQRPVCSVDAQAATQPAWTVTATALLLTGVADSTTYNFICIGQPGG